VAPGDPGTQGVQQAEADRVVSPGGGEEQAAAKKRLEQEGAGPPETIQEAATGEGSETREQHRPPEGDAQSGGAPPHVVADRSYQDAEPVHP